MSSTVTRFLLLLGVAGVLVAAPKAGDETHPRASGQALEIVFTPWYCSECIEKKLIDAEYRDVEIMNTGASDQALELKLRRGWLIIESPNFRVFSTLKGANVKHADTRFAAPDLKRLARIFPDFRPGASGSYVTRHQRAHLYHIRLERIVSHFRALTRNDKPFLGMEKRFEVFLFEDHKQYARFVEKSLGREFDKNVPVLRQHFTEDSRLVMATTASLFKGKDRGLNNAVIHHAAHMIVNGHRKFLTDVWAWLEAGTAHFYERRESPQFNYFCLQNRLPPGDFVRGNWRKKIRHLVYRKKDPSLGTWCGKHSPTELTGLEHAVAWSLVDWLAATDPIRLAKLLDLSCDPDKPTSTEAIEKVYGITPYELHKRWRKYVLEKY